MFVHLGGGPSGAQEAEGQRREMLTFLQGPGAVEGMRTGQMDLNRPCGKAGLREKCGHNVAWLIHGFAQLAT